MEPLSDEVELLSQAARPSLLDVAGRPELFFSLILANLMSEKVWDFAARIRERLLARAGRAALGDKDAIMGEIHDYANRKLKHETPGDVVRLRGVEDLDEDRRRLGYEEVDYPVSVIIAGEEFRRLQGDAPEYDVLFGLAESGRLPDYEYATLDLSEAYPRAAKGRGRLGVTSCADEAALAASLACLLGPLPLTDLVVLGSPLHYSTFALYPSGGYWFNGKREGFTARAWAEMAGDEGEVGLRRALDERAAIVDRTIAWSGTHLMREDRSTIPEAELTRINQALRRFLGVQPPGLRAALERPVVYEPAPPAPSLDVAAMADAADVREAVAALAPAHPRSVYAMAPYTFRSLHVERPAAYVRAGLRGQRIREAAARVGSVAEACGVANAIQGHEPVLGDSERIALPDEALLLDRAGQRDRALLILCLVALSDRIPPDQKRDLALVFTPETSHVRVGGRFVDAETGRETDRPATTPEAMVVEAPAVEGTGGGDA